MTDMNQQWEDAGPCVDLPEGEIHIWKLALDLELPTLERYLGTLSSDERKRAKAYPRDLDSFRAIACRGRLREILSLYGAGQPAEIQFRQGLLAVALDRELGVDLERIRPELNIESIALALFTPGEQALLQAVEAEGRPRVFFNCWTLKEACFKARSQSGALPLERIDVTRAQADPVWRLQLLDLGEELAAGLAFEQAPQHAPVRLRYLRRAGKEQTLLPTDPMNGMER
jgi:4'-phosphopantetheinyl transferase